MDSCVVRFAPSPSGYLHIGGARTAIFNWLYARKHGGRFILRIEDTDATRSSEASVQGILDGLRWLGLDWDDGPFFQSRHLADHRAAVERLLASGNAYRCFCSREELDAKREAARSAKQTYRYDGACRRLTADRIAALTAAGRDHVVRFKVPRGEGAVAFDDRVYGRVVKRLDDIEDFVLMRTNGQPLYVLANAVDDIRDGVTHVIRGQDGLANTPKQVLIYQALGAPLPVFAHMSLTLDPQKAKISKRRHGEHVAIHYYREQGFLPWAMVNFLVLLGWATTDARELFTPQELVAAFDLEGIGRTNSVFHIQPDDPKFITDPKLLSINAHYLRSMPIEALRPHVKDRLTAEGVWQADFDGARRGWFDQTVDLIRARFHRLTDFATYGRAYFDDTYAMDPDAVARHLRQQPDTARWMPALADTLAAVEPFDAKSVEAALRAFLGQWGIKPGQLVNGVRTAVTGQAVGPELIQVLVCIGRERVVARLRRATDSL